MKPQSYLAQIVDYQHTTPKPFRIRMSIVRAFAIRDEGMQRKLRAVNRLAALDSTSVIGLSFCDNPKHTSGQSNVILDNLAGPVDSLL
jgi:hypothetical protein